MCPLEIIGWIVVGINAVGVVLAFGAAIFCMATDIDNYDDWERKQGVKHGSL